MEALLSLFFTFAIVVLSFGFAALMMLVTVGFTAGMIYWRLKNGGGIVISVPSLVFPVVPVAPPPKPRHVKVSTCSACGASRTTPTKTAYMYCDCCGQLMDWDFRAAMSDRRSKAPGPAYEALLRKYAPALQQARGDGEKAAYEEIQKTLWEAYAKACPAALSPRIGDPRYRERWVAWSAKSQAEQDLNPRTAATLEAQTRATQQLVWDRSNPFQPRAELTSFHKLLDAVADHQTAVCDVLEESGLLEDHPDHVANDVMRKMGLSVFVQGWMAYVPPSEHDALLKKTGLDGEYVEPQAADLTKGTCPQCTAPLEVPANAKRVVCESCGHNVLVKGGHLPCHGCGASIDIPDHGKDFNCPKCDLYVARIGL
ncbi:MAG: hypothetical protein R3F61_12300 [Myxococcota bacterium]